MNWLALVKRLGLTEPPAPGDEMMWRISDRYQDADPDILSGERQVAYLRRVNHTVTFSMLGLPTILGVIQDEGRTLLVGPEDGAFLDEFVAEVVGSGVPAIRCEL